MLEMSFTDDQLLNLLNNTVESKTEFAIEKFTGGSIGVTSTNNNTQINYKVHLFFGYKNKKPISRSITIEKELFYIWCKALMLKVASLKNDNLGMNYSELNMLMNSTANSISISKKEKKSIVGVDLPVPLLQDIVTLQQLDLNANQLKTLDITSIGFCNHTIKYIQEHSLQEVITLSIDNTRYLAQELKKDY